MYLKYLIKKVFPFTGARGDGKKRDFKNKVDVVHWTVFSKKPGKMKQILCYEWLPEWAR